MKKGDNDYSVEAEKDKQQDIKLLSRDQQIDFGEKDEDATVDDDIQPTLGLINDRDNETPVIKEETMVPKISDKTVNIFGKKAE